MQGNTLRLNISYLTITHILRLRYHPKIMGYILKNKQKSKRVFIHATTQIIIMKTKMKQKNRVNIGTAKIVLGLDRDTKIVNKKLSLYGNAYMN